MLYKYLNYKDFIREKIQNNKQVKGYQGLLAKAASCQRPYISQVMNAYSDLSLEQAAGLCDFWQLSEDETEYFLCLVEYARASTPLLKRIVKKKITKYRANHDNLSKRFKKPGVNSIEAQASYYSSWSWAATHILLTIPEFNSIEKICKRLTLSPEEVNFILSGLEGMGLIVKDISGWKLTQKHIHLPKESPFNSINHMNWRQKAIQNSMHKSDDSLHYTGVHSLSVEDIDQIKAICHSSIDNIHNVIRPSKEEDLIYLGIDLFRV